MLSKQYVTLKKCIFSLIGAVLWIHTNPANAITFAEKTVTMWAPYLEWQIADANAQGNPYDIVATVTFSHATAKSRITEMFYAGNNTWKFRFTGATTGRWTFATDSTTADLSNHSGSINVIANPDANIKGFLTSIGNKFARQIDQNTFEGVILNIYQNSNNDGFPLNGNITSFSNASTVENYVQETKTNGFNAIFAVLYNEWLQAGAQSYADLNTSDPEVYNPDPITFQALESLITTAHGLGMHVHLWAWGDDSRKLTPIGLPGGINGTVDRRIQRHIAARLGPLPGWSMGYGFDLNEWVSVAELDAWAAFLKQRFGWRHLLWGRREGGGRGTEMDVIAYSFTNQRSYNEVVANLDSDLTRPHLFAERDLYLRGDVFSMDVTRRQLWLYAMAGGHGGWWGALWNRTGPAYPNPEQLRNYAQFWRQRFFYDLVRANDLTDGYGLKSATDSRYIFYKAKTTSLQMNLSQYSGAAEKFTAVAVDAAKDYVEIDVSGLTKISDFVWNAPYRSDWAIAVGDFGETKIPPLSVPQAPTGLKIEMMRK